MTDRIPAQLADEALFLSLAVYTNLATCPEVIAWADGWTERLDVWPEQLTEISLSSRHKDSGTMTALAELALASSLQDFPCQLVEQALNNLQSGQDPFQVISDLYPLVYRRIELGGLELPVTLPDILRTVISELDGDAESVDRDFTWVDTQGQKPADWLSGRIQEGLQRALATMAGQGD